LLRESGKREGLNAAAAALKQLGLFEEVFEEQEVDFSGKFDPRDHPQPSFNVAGSADKEILQFHFGEAAVTAAA
jgi:hypothetical protein